MTTPRFSKLLPAAALTWAAIASPSDAQQASAPQPPLNDKTLVVWVAPANLTQRGGSALTIDDGRDNFDAIVLGEIAPQKWMAGSDFYRRTLRDQAGFPAETADAKTFVQMAIVYAGKQITVYRNGTLYSQHTMAEAPLEFGLAARFNIGKRHRKQTDPAHFAGAIDDARIYDRALSAEQITALKPNEASAVKPWAWWSFDDKADRTGRFAITELTGISGDALELQLTFQPGTAKAFGLEVYCDAAGKNGFPVTLEPAAKTLHVGAVAVPFELKAGESATLRVFLDKSMIEVFVNDRQAAVGSHRYTDGNTGIQLISKGGETVAAEVKAWRMQSIYADATKQQ